MLSFLYNVFITPIESLVEFIFFFMNKIFVGRPAISIVFVSLTINLLILPLYKRADDMQEREREKVKAMERWNKHIKKTFKGDERYMMQSAYYRIEGYKPIYAVTGSLSLLFQIPFFIAAYHFLSHLDLLNGVSFFLIQDLGAEDRIIKLGSLSINLLPVLMTAINIVSGAIYTKGFRLKDKIQLYAMALIFLVLLYKSPAGLVFYWTLNNLFSLLKNVFFKIVKHKRLSINIISAAFGTGLFFLLLKSGKLVARRQVLVFGLIMVISFVPALLSLLDKIAGGFKEKLAAGLEVKTSEAGDIDKMFWLGAVLNTVLLGLMVPAQLISSSPTEFGTLVHGSPLELVLNTFSIYIGLFLVWIGVFYAISSNALKKVFAYGVWIIGVCALVNYYVFYGKFGIMSYMLVFDNAPEFNDWGKLLNIGALLLIAVVLVIVAKKWPKVSTGALSVLVMMTVIISAMSMIKTQNNLKEEGYFEYKQDKTIGPTVALSKGGKNVMVIMLDRAINEYVPYIFQEKPEIAKQFEDFVYYPNTTSFGGCTNFATPALFGGYEYTPAEMNKRSDEKLVDKHNEALKVVPVLFSQNGYEVSVVDPPYANYKEIPDASIFDEYDNIQGFETFSKYAEYEVYTDDELVSQKKHVAAYSLFRTAPVVLQNSIYDGGNYLGKPSGSDEWKSLSTTYCAEGYAVLDYLDEYTYVENDDKDRLVVLSNCTTHEPTWLETPDYVIGPNTTDPTPEYLETLVIDDQRLFMNDYEDIEHYHVNVAAYKLLAEFFLHMKEEGIFDNTRIIIVSDHGWPVNQMENVMFDEATGNSVETFNPVLLVKDFADSDALKQGDVWYLEEADLNVCDTFMTNADVATLCVTGLIENPVNPFTGKEINSEQKNNLPMIITSSRNTIVSQNCGNIYDTSDSPWVEFSGGKVKDLSNWKIMDE